MGKYLSALLGNKPSGYELPKLTDPPLKNGFDSFDSFDSLNKGDIYPQKYQIEKLTDCLHGRKCKNLESLPPARPLCLVSGEPVFDLIECPAGWWRACRDGALTEYVLMPGPVMRL